jgi:hypothetical protein
MPRIPDVTSLGERRVPVGRAPVYQDRSTEIAAESLDNAARQLGSAVVDFADRRDNFRVAKAGAAFSTAEASARQFQDNDWETYETRYRDSMTKAKEAALKDVRLPANRQALELEFDSAVERGLLSVRQSARAKEIEFGKADLSSMLDSYRTAALSSTDEAMRAKSINGAQLAIKSALDNQYIEATDAERLNKTWTQSYAEGFLSMQPAEKRIEMLSKPKGTVVDHIAPDRRAALLEAAKNENRDLTVRRESQAQEDAIVEKFGTGPAALKAAREIDDPEVRDSTVSRIKARQAEAKQAEMEYTEALSEEALAFINGGGKFADLPLKIKNGLKPSALNSLRSYAEQQAGGGRRSTDPETLIELSELSADDPQKFGELNMLEYRDKLSDGDFEEFVDLQRKVRTGSIDGKATGFMTMNQVRDERLRDLFGSAMPTAKEGDKTSLARRKFIEQYEARLRSFRDESGKRPGADDARKILDDLTADVAINRDYWFDTSKKVFELGEDDIPEVPEADRNEIIRELQKRGKAVTEDAIVGLYRTVNGK